jgi:hypothetical protein
VNTSRLDDFSGINTYKIDSGTLVRFLEYYLPLSLSIYPHFVFMLFDLIFTFDFVGTNWICWCYMPLSYVSFG